MITSNPAIAHEFPATSGTILWLTGWSMPDSVFDDLRRQLTNFHHVSADYSAADTPEEMLRLAFNAALSHRLKLPAGGADGSSRTSGGPLVIAGWSLGGLLALKLAAEGLADGLVLMAANACFTRPREESDRGWPDVYIRKMIAGLSKDRITVENDFRQLLFAEADREAGIDRQLPTIGSWTTAALIAGLTILRNEDCLPQLAEISCPVIVVHGNEDRVCPYNAAAELASQLPHAALLTIPMCGHAPFLGREAEIAERLGRWWIERQSTSSI